MVARKDGKEILRCAQNDRTGDALLGTRDGRSRAPPLRFYISVEENRWAIRESPLRILSKQEGVIKGETRCCPLEIASARSAGKHVSGETCAIENPTTACGPPEGELPRSGKRSHPGVPFDKGGYGRADGRSRAPPLRFYMSVEII